VFCGTCGMCLGLYREGFAKAHLRDFPEHDEFLVKAIIDPLMLPEPELRARFAMLEGRFPTKLGQPRKQPDTGQYRTLLPAPYIVEGTICT
jgi:hypothetical protein